MEGNKNKFFKNLIQINVGLNGPFYNIINKNKKEGG